MLFRKPRAPVEMVSDLHAQLVGFLRVLQEPEQAGQLAKLLRETPYSRAEFARCKAEPEHRDPVEQARRFYVRCNQASRGRIDNGWQDTSWRKEPATWLRKIERLPLATARLRGVVINHQHALDFLYAYDDRGVLLYLDPCYHQSTRGRMNAYQHEMTDADHERLLNVITSMKKAYIVLSGYDCDLYRGYLRNWRRIDIPVTLSASAHKIKRFESLWLNW